MKSRDMKMLKEKCLERTKIKISLGLFGSNAETYIHNIIQRYIFAVIRFFETNSHYKRILNKIKQNKEKGCKIMLHQQ